MKKWMFILLTSFTLILLSACGKTDVDLTLGIDTAAGGSPQFRSADAQNYYEEEGLTTQIISFAYGIDIINALMIERVEAGLAADYALLNSLNRGDMVILGTLNRADEHSMDSNKVIAMGDIHDPSELKGKNIAIANGTVVEYYWAKYLESIGLSESDVNILKYTSPDEAMIGMKNGDMDAVIASGSQAAKFQSLKGAKVIDDLSSAGVGLNMYLISNRSYAQSHVEELSKLIKAIAKGNELVINQPEKAAEITHDQIKIDTKDALTDIQDTSFVMSFTQYDYDNLNTMKQYLVKNGRIQKDFAIEDKLFLEPLKQAFPEEVSYN